MWRGSTVRARARLEKVVDLRSLLILPPPLLCFFLIPPYNRFIMSSDEVYDGAIGIDLGKFCESARTHE